MLFLPQIKGTSPPRTVTVSGLGVQGPVVSSVVKLCIDFLLSLLKHDSCVVFC